MRHDNDDKDCPISPELTALSVRYDFLSKQQDRYDEMLQRVIEMQTTMGSRVLELEHLQESDSKILHELRSNDKLQNKLLTAIFTALVGIFISIVSKYVLNGGH